MYINKLIDKNELLPFPSPVWINQGNDFAQSGLKPERLCLALGLTASGAWRLAGAWQLSLSAESDAEQALTSSPWLLFLTFSLSSFFPVDLKNVVMFSWLPLAMLLADATKFPGKRHKICSANQIAGSKTGSAPIKRPVAFVAILNVSGFQTLRDNQHVIYFTYVPRTNLTNIMSKSPNTAESRKRLRWWVVFKAYRHAVKACRLN